MELSQIRYFTVLARTLHFTRAAEECAVSQPALTRAIQKLEEELGGPLFHRERGHTQLTDLGRTVRPALERTMESVREARTEAQAFGRCETSPLRIGLEYSVPASLLTQAMATLRRHNQDISLSLRQGSQTDLCDRMLGSEIDLALLVDSPTLPERMHRWPLFYERYMVICPPGHRFQDRETIGIRDIAEECLLLNEDAACPVRRFIGALCETADTKPRRQHFANNFEQILEMVQASLGISLAGERMTTMAPMLRRPIVAEPSGRNIVLGAVAGRPLGPTPALFLKMLRARAWSLDAAEAAAA